MKKRLKSLIKKFRFWVFLVSILAFVFGKYLEVPYLVEYKKVEDVVKKGAGDPYFKYRYVGIDGREYAHHIFYTESTGWGKWEIESVLTRTLGDDFVFVHSRTAELIYGVAMLCLIISGLMCIFALLPNMACSSISAVWGMIICLFFAAASFIAGISGGSGFIGSIFCLFFIFVGAKINNDTVKETESEVSETQKQYEYEDEYDASEYDEDEYDGEEDEDGYEEAARESCQCPRCGRIKGHEIEENFNGLSEEMFSVTNSKLKKKYRCEYCKYEW